MANSNLLVSVGLDGNSGRGGASYSPVISADGRYVVFVSGATNLVAGDTNGAVDVFRRDLQTGTTALVSLILKRQSIALERQFRHIRCLVSRQQPGWPLRRVPLPHQHSPAR